MTAVNLTAKTIAEAEHPETGQRFLWDAKVKGLAMRATKSTKRYVVESRVAGRTRRVTIGDVSLFTVDEARREAKKLLGQMAADVDPNAAKAEARARSITLGEALDAYVQDRALKPTTAAEYRARLQSNMPDWIGRELKLITPTAVVKRFDKLVKEHSPHVATGAMRVFRAIYGFARAYTATDAGTYVLPENPCMRLKDLKRWPKATRRMEYLTDDQFPAFFAGLADAHSDTSADYFELLLRTGLRRNEAATLLWSDVNMNTRTFTIRASVAKNGKALTLPMSRQTFALFQRRREAVPEAVAVFATSTRFDPRKSLLRLREGLSGDITLHDLRRTAAILAERIGTPYSLLKRMLNHSAAGDVTTMHYLVGNDPETLRPYAQAVSDLIDTLVGRFGPFPRANQEDVPIHFH